MKEIIQELAAEDDRTLAWIVRKLFAEALEERVLAKILKRVRPLFNERSFYSFV